MALYRSPLTVTLWPSSFLNGPMIPPAHKARQTAIEKYVAQIQTDFTRRILLAIKALLTDSPPTENCSTPPSETL
ncbi:hypothetical protein TNCV_739691 [Trichonephila clavipes]|nr:hypothetical protein TNCV_739691 [Trichonephila clavipes]